MLLEIDQVLESVLKSYFVPIIVNWQKLGKEIQFLFSILFEASTSVHSLKGLSGTGTGCPGKWWIHCSWRDLKAVWMWHLGMAVCDGLGSAGVVLGLGELRGFSQSKWFHDCVYSVLHLDRNREFSPTSSLPILCAFISSWGLYHAPLLLFKQLFKILNSKIPCFLPIIKYLK